MTDLLDIPNLKIYQVTEDILFIKQIKAPAYFSCCDGLVLLPQKNRNNDTVIVDLNIEPQYCKKINQVFGPISHYINSHGHMDHIAHVHAWGKLGAQIHAPFPESGNLVDLRNFYKSFGFDSKLSYSTIEKFGGMNGYQPCETVRKFKRGETLYLDNLEIETIPLMGHSKSHHGFYIKKEGLVHISCLGFDKSKPGEDGFGPWYGFKECSISQYMEDIEKAESLFLEGAKFLTSGHAYPIKHPNREPFRYMRKKIKDNQIKFEHALHQLNIQIKGENYEKIIERLLALDLFFPKRKIDGFLNDIYRFWEYWIIKNHLILYSDYNLT
jgi:glyoxylase-like metal-dependent hydrolase (beta-lactamase superfamily II)